MQFRRKFDLSMFGISVKHQLNGRLFSLHWSQLCTSHTVDKSRRMNFIPWHLLSEPDEIFFFLEAEFNLQTISCGRIPIFPATRSTVFDVCYFVNAQTHSIYCIERWKGTNVSQKVELWTTSSIFKKILANQFKISCEKFPLKISWLRRYRTFSSPGCCVAWLHRKTRVDRVHTVWKVREKSIKFWVGQGELENFREFFLKSYMMRENQGNILNISCGEFSEALFLQA